MTIKQLRTINNLTQRDFAKLIGVSQTAVYLWEKTDTKLTDKHTEAIDNTFGFKRGIKKASSFDLGI